MRSLLASGLVLLVATSLAKADPLTIAGITIDAGEVAFVDDATLTSGTIRYTCTTGGWTPASSVAEALVGSDLMQCVNNNTGDSGTVELRYTDNAIQNRPGPDLVVFELSGALPAGTADNRERFGLRVFDGTSYGSFQYFDPIASGVNACGDPSVCLDVFTVQVDLSDFGIADGALVDRLELHIYDVGLGSKSADISAVAALHSSPPAPVCGNGAVNTGEQCDSGAANSDTTPDACRTTCTLPTCGDGTIDSGEECDGGASNSDTEPNACRTTCVLPSCGDAVVDTGESCDEGSANSNSAPNACRTTCALATCGDGAIDSGEACDAGSANSDTAPDACRTTCTLATCGDGVIDSGEQCDDSGTTRFDGCNAVCAIEGGFQCSGQPSTCSVVPSPQSKAQQRCLVAMNKGAAQVSGAWTSESARCMHLAAGEGVDEFGDPLRADACLVSTIPARVQKATAKLASVASRSCLSDPSRLPTYAYQSSAAISDAAGEQALALLDDLFGADLDAALVPIVADKRGAACQATVQKSASKVLATSLRTFVACKSGALSGRVRFTAEGPVESLMELQDDMLACLTSARAGSTGKIHKAVAALQSAVVEKCGTTGIATPLADLVPGCSASTVGGLLACTQRAAACRFCQTINAADGLGISCDLYDDAAANGSCP